MRFTRGLDLFTSKLCALKHVDLSFFWSYNIIDEEITESESSEVNIIERN